MKLKFLYRKSMKLYQQNNYIVFLFIFFISFNINAQKNVCVSVSDITDEKILDQIDRDNTLIPMGKGALFVPYIFDGQREPLYTIMWGNRHITDAQPGSRVALNPGNYTIFVGSGPLDQRLEIPVFIEQERLSVVIPGWSALIVNVIDEFSNPQKTSYQIIDEETKLIVGSGIGVDEFLGEKAQVWILKPGLYRISKKGESPDSLKNFITVRLMPNFHSEAKLVFDETGTTLLGGGEISESQKEQAAKGDWSYRAVVSGNFSFTNTSYLTVGEEESNNYIFGSTMNASLKYEVEDFLFSNRLEIRERFQRLENDNFDDHLFLFTEDLLKLDSSFIYRFNKWVGPYIALRARTKLFDDHYLVEDDSDSAISDQVTTYIQEKDGSRRALKKGSYFTSSHSFSPTTIQEGIGINFEYKHGNIFDVTTRLGYGFKQDISPNYYDQSQSIQSETDSNNQKRLVKILPRVETFHMTHGPEFYFNFSYIPASMIELKEDFITLIPSTNTDETYFVSESTITIWISSFATIEYLYRIERQPSIYEGIKNDHNLIIQLYYKLL